MERKSIKLHKDTYDDLDELRRPGQTFTGAVQELIETHQQKVRQ